MKQRAVALLFFASASFGCGSHSAHSSDGTSVCAQTFTTLCQRACACGGSSCSLVGSTGAGITFSSEADCTELYVLACDIDGGVRPDFDYGACMSAISSASCVSAPGGGTGAAYPAVCNPNAIDAGGPDGG